MELDAAVLGATVQSSVVADRPLRTIPLGGEAIFGKLDLGGRA
jgi:hypothetical protein